MGWFCKADQYLGAIMAAEHSFTATAPDNTRVRAAMAAFAANPTADERVHLLYTMLEEHFVVLIPMREEPDGTMAFTTTVEGDPHPILHVYTSMDELPPLDHGVEVYLLPYADLLMDMLQGEQRWNGLIIDADAAHSVTAYFTDTGEHALYSTAALRAAVDGVDPELN